MREWERDGARGAGPAPLRAKGRTHGNALGIGCANISVRHGNRAHFDDGRFTPETTSQNKLLSDFLAVPFTSHPSPTPACALEAPSRPCRAAGGRGGGAYQFRTAGGKELEAGRRGRGITYARCAPRKGAWARRGARWEMQSSPSERLNLGRGSLPLASEDFFFPLVPQGLRAKRRELSFDFQENRGIGPARANTGARLRRWFRKINPTPLPQRKTTRDPTGTPEEEAGLPASAPH